MATELLARETGGSVTQTMSRRHVLVIVSGCMMTFGCAALGFSTWGLFQPVVSESLGVPKTSFALYITVMYLTMTAFSPIAGKILQTRDVRVVLTGAACLVSLSFLLTSFATNIWVFYLAGVLLGMGEIFILWLAIPMLINNWFAKRSGSIIGLCMAFTVLLSGGTDFHMIYRLWAVIALVTAVPFTLFCVSSRPSDVGLLPYGASSVSGKTEPTKGLSVHLAMRSPVFYALCMFAGVINFTVLIAMQFPTYTKQLSGATFDVLVVGGIMSTVMMVGQAIGKVSIGTVADRSARGALVFAVSAGAVGIILRWLGYRLPYVLYSGAFIFGFFYATALVLVPVLVRLIFGVREYSLIYSRVSTVFNFIAAFASVTWAFIGTNFGFSTVFIVGLLLLVVVLGFGSYILSKTRQTQAAWS